MRLIDAEYDDFGNIVSITVDDYQDDDGVKIDTMHHSKWTNPFINKYGHPCHCCAWCGFEASQQDKNFCPNCGARMEGD